MYEKQNKHHTFNVCPERNVRNVTFHFLFTWRKSEFVSLRACSFYYGVIANLRKHILHQMRTRLSFRWIISAACGNHWKPFLRQKVSTPKKISLLRF